MTTRDDVKTELLALAERCEKATRPDAYADYLIHAHVMGWRIPDELNCFTWCVGENYQFGHPDDERRAIYISENDLPNYTLSLDAAMSLVPEGDHVVLSSIHPDEEVMDGRWHALVGAPESTVDPSHGATPALALCAAALRAQQTRFGRCGPK